MTRHLISTAENERPNHRFCRPAVFRKPSCQMIKQLRMGKGVAPAHPDYRPTGQSHARKGDARFDSQQLATRAGWQECSWRDSRDPLPGSRIRPPAAAWSVLGRTMSHDHRKASRNRRGTRFLWCTGIATHQQIFVNAVSIQGSREPDPIPTGPALQVLSLRSGAPPDRSARHHDKIMICVRQSNGARFTRSSNKGSIRCRRSR